MRCENAAIFTAGFMFVLGGLILMAYGILTLIFHGNPIGYTLAAFGLLSGVFGLDMIKTSRQHSEYNLGSIPVGPVIQLATFRRVSMSQANPVTTEDHGGTSQASFYVDEAYTGAPVFSANLQDHAVDTESFI